MVGRWNVLFTRAYSCQKGIHEKNGTCILLKKSNTSHLKRWCFPSKESFIFQPSILQRQKMAVRFRDCTLHPEFTKYVSYDFRISGWAGFTHFTLLNWWIYRFTPHIFGVVQPSSRPSSSPKKTHHPYIWPNYDISRNLDFPEISGCPFLQLPLGVTKRERPL